MVMTVCRDSTCETFGEKASEVPVVDNHQAEEHEASVNFEALDLQEVRGMNGNFI